MQSLPPPGANARPQPRGAVAGATGIAGTVMTRSTPTPDESAHALSPLVGYSLAGIGAVVLIVAVIALVKKRAGSKGWRTLIVAGATGLIGLADVLGAVDLRPLVRVFVNGDEAAVGAVMTALALGFALLRMITTGPVGERETR
jgi:hypothetical protein